MQPPKAVVAPVGYDVPPTRHLYELRRRGDDSGFVPWPLEKTTKLVERIRDNVAARLRKAASESAEAVERIIIGRKADGSDGGPIEQRVRIVPLPSIGHLHADRAIRRVLIEVPAGGALLPADVTWAVSGLETSDPDTGELDGVILQNAADGSMLAHYMEAARVWRSVTPVALHESAARRRIEPKRRIEEAKAADERQSENARAIAGVYTALRHAGIRTPAQHVIVQREPFEARGTRAEAFATGTRFQKERLWHVEVTFAEARSGPIVIGDGRFLGLGLMAPAREPLGVREFVVHGGLLPGARPEDIARAFKRAVMSRVQGLLGKGEKLSAFFTGHDGAEFGAPSRKSHLAYAYHAPTRRLLLLAPHAIDRRWAYRDEVDELAHLDSALEGFRELRAGSAGVLLLQPTVTDPRHDPLLAPSRKWTSETEYVVTRHAKRTAAAEVISSDVRDECVRRGLPTPVVTVGDARGVPGLGLVGSVRLTFSVAVAGPLALGRTRYLGGGLFAGSAVSATDGNSANAP